MAIFQSTLPRGSDYKPHRPQQARTKFQSTLPRGSDRTHTSNLTISSNFNPRSLAGATFLLLIPSSLLIFQSTLPRGSDISDVVTRIGPLDFNPRSLAGATNRFY